MKRLQDIQKTAISEEMDMPKSRGENGTTNKADADSDESNEDDGDDGEKTSAPQENIRDTEKMAVDETPEQRALREKQRELISSLDLSK